MQFIVALCYLIQRLVVDHLHIVGDIYDRGPGPHVIMDTLSEYHSVDVQWGNHDVVWMGAASGQPACIATVIRIAARYGSLDTLEEGYGIRQRFYRLVGKLTAEAYSAQIQAWCQAHGGIFSGHYLG